MAEQSRGALVKDLFRRLSEVCKGERTPDDDVQQLLDMFGIELGEPLPTHVIEMFNGLVLLQAWLNKVEATRIGCAAGDPRARKVPNGEDYFWRPMIEGLCRYTDLIDGTLTLGNVVEMNCLLDIAEENRRLSATAGDANVELRLDPEPLDLAVERERYVAECKSKGQRPGQNGFYSWARNSESEELRRVTQTRLRQVFKEKYLEGPGRPPKK